MLRKTVYPKIESLLGRIADALNQRGFTPNQLTIAGLVFMLIAGFCYASGYFFLGGLVTLLSSAADILDGPLARRSGKGSQFGAFLDSTIDRYSDFFLFGGIATYYAKEGQGGYFLLSMGILMGAYATSYTKARSENFIKDCSVGVFGRAERIIPIIIASLIRPLMPIVLFVLCIGCNVTAIHRILHTKKTLTNTTTPPEEKPTL